MQVECAPCVASDTLLHVLVAHEVDEGESLFLGQHAPFFVGFAKFIDPPEIPRHDLDVVIQLSQRRSELTVIHHHLRAALRGALLAKQRD